MPLARWTCGLETSPFALAPPELPEHSGFCDSVCIANSAECLEKFTRDLCGVTLWSGSTVAGTPLGHAAREVVAAPFDLVV